MDTPPLFEPSKNSTLVVVIYFLNFNILEFRFNLAKKEPGLACYSQKLTRLYEQNLVQSSTRLYLYRPDNTHVHGKNDLLFLGLFIYCFVFCFWFFFVFASFYDF